MEEAEMVEELRKRGYRVSRPPKPKVEFKPFAAIRILHYEIAPRKVQVIRESRKHVFIKTDYGEQEVKKREIYQLNPEALKIWADAEREVKALRRQAEKLEDQIGKIEDEASDKIEKILKPAYPEEKKSP